MIYDKHDSTFRCKYLAGDTVGRRRRLNEEGMGDFLIHLPRPLKGYKRHEAIYRAVNTSASRYLSHKRYSWAVNQPEWVSSAIFHLVYIRKQGLWLESYQFYIQYQQVKIFFFRWVMARDVID